ncbi:MAG: hypothetical protein Q4G30_09235 [Actinomycetaceae bacterium]|nr:hypothetical protein [Actinomycetaceae bacterium]
MSKKMTALVALITALALTGCAAKDKAAENDTADVNPVATDSATPSETPVKTYTAESALIFAPDEPLPEKGTPDYEARVDALFVEDKKVVQEMIDASAQMQEPSECPQDNDYWCANPERTWKPVFTGHAWDYEPQYQTDEAIRATRSKPTLDNAILLEQTARDAGITKEELLK